MQGNHCTTWSRPYLPGLVLCHSCQTSQTNGAAGKFSFLFCCNARRAWKRHVYERVCTWPCHGKCQYNIRCQLLSRQFLDADRLRYKRKIPTWLRRPPYSCRKTKVTSHHFRSHAHRCWCDHPACQVTLTADDVVRDLRFLWLCRYWNHAPIPVCLVQILCNHYRVSRLPPSYLDPVLHPRNSI